MIFLADNIEFILNIEDSYIDLLGCAPAEDSRQLSHVVIQRPESPVHWRLPDNMGLTERQLKREEQSCGSPGQEPSLPSQEQRTLESSDTVPDNSALIPANPAGLHAEVV